MSGKSWAGYAASLHVGQPRKAISGAPADIDLASSANAKHVEPPESTALWACISWAEVALAVDNSWRASRVRETNSQPRLANSVAFRRNAVSCAHTGCEAGIPPEALSTATGSEAPSRAGGNGLGGCRDVDDAERGASSLRPEREVRAAT